jgi:hypothetical protein
VVEKKETEEEKETICLPWSQQPFSIIQPIHCIFLIFVLLFSFSNSLRICKNRLFSFYFLFKILFLKYD